MVKNKFEYKLPPSTNRMYSVANNRLFKTAIYKKWSMRTVPLVRNNFRGRYLEAKQPAEVIIRANISRRRDLDNILKPIIDCLEDAGVIPNDNYVDRIDLEKDFSITKQHFTVEVNKYGD